MTTTSTGASQPPAASDPTGTVDPTAPAPAPAPAAQPAARLGTRIAWVWVLLSSLAIAAFAVTPYLTASLRSLAESPSGGLAGNYAEQPWPIQLALYAHIVGGGLALVLGPLQFWRSLRTRHPRVHRWTGRTYLTAVGIGGLAALVIAPVNDAGLVGLFGFGGLGVVWLLTGTLAYRAIRRGDVASHRAWMMRNFALTYAAVTLRIWIPLLIVAQLPFTSGAFDFDAVFANAYAAVPFLCWLPNLLVAEWLIARRGRPAFRPAAVALPAAG
ncbi:DUF2306 domain-containing protein [Agromyces allii]|uniref:DUF2306 domain-containing protein n=1 Tax=Agromyces allii TaxID=393607 RepID=A0ABP5CBQ4_9MICO|nr:DUF2306 domain-containing protein [Agromyces allii]